ncbi:MAG: hypothetical protein ACI9F9_002630 [Candidatus Paceibacteria bacterium]|jgi:hypothetical protein
MNTIKLLTLLSVGAAIAAPAQAQFSVSGPGSPVPASGNGGGTWDTGMPVAPGISTVDVPVDVGAITSVEIDGLNHTWAGDVHATLADPSGFEHNLFLRPGYENPAGSGFGTPGDFVLGDYMIVESGGMSLPTVSDGANIQPGTYNQTFFTGGVTWVDGQSNIYNTPLGSIQGLAGTWTLRIYDWGLGDSGGFSGWTLNGLEPGSTGPSAGDAYCFGDGTGAACPCSGTGALGAGCLTTSGTGATLVASGTPDVNNDSFQLDVSGGPANKPGIFFQGTNQLGVPAGDGVLCSNATKRYGVNSLDATGSVTQAGFGAFASIGSSLNYQYWFRDPGNSCGGGFNFSGGWVVTWQ